MVNAVGTQRGSPTVGEHGGDEQREGGDRGRHADRPAQRRRQHVVVAQRVEAAAEASDAERRGGDEGDGTEHGCLAAHVEQPLAAVGVEREAEGSGGDEGAGVGDRREDRRAGTNAPAGVVPAEIELVGGEAVRRRRPDVEHRGPGDPVRVDRDDFPDHGVGAVGETVGELDGDRLVLERRRRGHVVGIVIEHAHRAAGQRHRLAERQHHVRRRDVDDLAVGRRDADQLGVRGRRAVAEEKGYGRDDGTDQRTAHPLHSRCAARRMAERQPAPCPGAVTATISTPDGFMW